MADLVTQCSTPECLRGVGLQGGQCLPCQKSMPPMKNPNSPYAFSNNKPPSFAFTPPVTPPVANLPSPGSTNPTLTPQVKQNVKKWMTGKTDDEIKRLQKDAVQSIYSSYWFGWKDGVPEMFKDIFAQYGLFISDRAIASKMVGTPDTHKSTINARGKASFRIIMDAIYPYEGEGAAIRNIKQSPIMSEEVVGLNDKDIAELIKGDGEDFVFTKIGNGELYSYNRGGVTLKLPRWAIA